MSASRKPSVKADPASSSVRFRPEDWTMIHALRDKTGIESLTELLRLALRALADKEGLR